MRRLIYVSYGLSATTKEVDCVASGREKRRPGYDENELLYEESLDEGVKGIAVVR